MPALAIWALGALGLTGGGIGVAALLGGGPWMLLAARSALAFLGRLNIWQLLLIAALLIAGVQTLRLKGEQRHSAKLETQLSKCTAARHADREAYAKAQKDAQAANLATVARDKAERERITNDISQSYESDLARLRADLARRLRNPAPQGASGGSGLPGVSQAPGGPDGGSRLSIPSDLYVRGAELELQLERLQQWVAEQVAIDPNKR